MDKVLRIKVEKKKEKEEEITKEKRLKALHK